MARKSRRDDRRTRRTEAAKQEVSMPARVASISRKLPSREPTERNNKMNVAKAHRKLQGAVGDVVYQPRPRKTTRTATATQPLAKPVHKGANSSTPTKGGKPTVAADGPNLKSVPTCKKKPTSNKGNGGSRPFVPWCK